MNKEGFVALHGEEAYNALIRHPYDSVETAMVAAGMEARACEHGHRIIMIILNILGFPEAKGLLDVKVDIEQFSNAFTLQCIRNGDCSFVPIQTLPEQVRPKVAPEDNPLNKPANPTC